MPEPQGGALVPEDVVVIRAVCSAWEATPDEVADALAEAASNPALLANWRRDAERLGLIEEDAKPHTKPNTKPNSNPPMSDDRIRCLDCRRLKLGNICSSPSWAPRYHTRVDTLRRCGEFLPLTNADDRRTGRERWPQLAEKAP